MENKIVEKKNNLENVLMLNYDTLMMCNNLK